MTDYPNWFAQTAQPNFEQFLLPKSGKHNLHYLQLGAFTGDASVWLCQNVLNDYTCLLTDVDTWQGSDEPDHETMDFDDVFNTYLNKVGDYESTVIVKRTTTVDFLTSEYAKEQIYDFIYVDADHTTVGVLLDAELSWPLLKSGGIMAFDDYTWGHESGDPRLAPMVGIDLFLHRHQLDYELLAKNTQVWVRKK
jgi:hypothetical protein